MTGSLLSAIALVLIIEGLLPFVAPNTWRQTFRRAAELADGQLRFLGLSSILIGLAMLLIFG